MLKCIKIFISELNFLFYLPEKELEDIKEASQAIIQKQKELKEKEILIDKDKCKIITDKIYKNLKWYLIYEQNTETKKDENDYENYRWVNGLIIKEDQLDKYNKYQTDSQKIKDLEEYIMTLQKKLETKEEEPKAEEQPKTEEPQKTEEPKKEEPKGEEPKAEEPKKE